MIALIKTRPSVIAGKYSVKRRDVKLCTHHAAVYVLCCFVFQGRALDNHTHVYMCRIPLGAATASGQRAGDWVGLQRRMRKVFTKSFCLFLPAGQATKGTLGFSEEP